VDRAVRKIYRAIVVLRNCSWEAGHIAIVAAIIHFDPLPVAMVIHPVPKTVSGLRETNAPGQQNGNREINH
jgi:hypothetical protein